MIREVSFIGLGNMGTSMAQNLLHNGVTVHVYNRTKEKTALLIAEGAFLLESIDAAFEKAPLVFSMVSDDEALKQVSTEILKNAKPNCIHVSLSTVSPKTTRELMKQHAQKGVHLIAAPVFGRPDVAKAAKLWICMAGDPQAKAMVEPLLHLMGQKVSDFGDDPGNANMVKLTGNFLILSVVEMLAEAYAAARDNGIDVQKLHEFFTETLFPSPVIRTYGTLIANQQFTPGFRLELGLKDLNLFTDMTKDQHLAFRDILKQKLKEAIVKNWGNMDWSAIALSSLKNEA